MIRIIFDGPPGPESGRFIEVEDEDGASISVGEWKPDKRDGWWALEIDIPMPTLETLPHSGLGGGLGDEDG